MFSEKDDVERQIVFLISKFGRFKAAKTMIILVDIIFSIIVIIIIIIITRTDHVRMLTTSALYLPLSYGYGGIQSYGLWHTAVQSLEFS